MAAGNQQGFTGLVLFPVGVLMVRTQGRLNKEVLSERQRSCLHALGICPGRYRERQGETVRLLLTRLAWSPSPIDPEGG